MVVPGCSRDCQILRFEVQPLSCHLRPLRSDYEMATDYYYYKMATDYYYEMATDYYYYKMATVLVLLLTTNY